jgi:hypothetical protein
VGFFLVAACTGSRDGDAPSAINSSPSTSSDAGEAGPPQIPVGTGTSLGPGTYRFSFYANPGVEAPDALIEVPSGFDGEKGFYVVSHDQHEFLGLWTVGQVERDACHPSN